MNIDIIKPTAAVALADIARKMEQEGKTIIKLQTGDPDFATHVSIIEAANKAMLKGQTHYSFSQGLPVLRKKLAEIYSHEIGSAVDEEQIIVTHGAAEGFFATIAAIIEPQDEVLLLEPNWPTVDSLVLLMGGKPVKINALSTEEEIIKKLNQNYSSKTKMICFNTPNNPTGMVLSQSLIDNICDWAIQKNIYILADEVYRFLQFDVHKTTSIKFLKTYSKYIYINSFSKKFAMTGWRIGYILSESTLVKRILKPSQLAITNVAPFVQIAALEGLTNAESIAYSEVMLAEYERRRNALTDYCRFFKMEYLNPGGAFYLFIKLPLVGITDVEFCNKLLYDYNTCTIPGSAFGKSGSGFVRLSFANELETVKNGIDQVNLLINELKKTNSHG